MVDVKLPTLPPAPIGEATPHHTTRERGGHQKQTASERHTSHLPAPLLRPASPPLLSSPPKTRAARRARARHELVEPRRLPRQISRRALVSTRDPRPPSAARRLRPGASPALLPSACALVECSVGRSLFFLLLLLLLWFLSRSHLIYAMPLPTCRSRKENSPSLSLFPAVICVSIHVSDDGMGSRPAGRSRFGAPALGGDVTGDSGRLECGLELMHFATSNLTFLPSLLRLLEGRISIDSTCLFSWPQCST